MDELASRYDAVRTMVAAATAAAGRAPGSVGLLAVSKGQPPAAVRELYALGQRQFGENYAQELAAKAAALADLPELRFVYIGALQSNKLALVARSAAAVQSVASERHARRLAALARELGGAPYPVHLLVNAAGEATKGGLAQDEVLGLARLVGSELPQLRLCGIMAIPPPLMDGQDPRPLYRQLRLLADQVGAGELSLGMSADLAPAIAAGSDCVRIGTAIFGPRAAATHNRGPAR